MHQTCLGKWMDTYCFASAPAYTQTLFYFIYSDPPPVLLPPLNYLLTKLSDWTDGFALGTLTIGMNFRSSAYLLDECLYDLAWQLSYLWGTTSRTDSNWVSEHLEHCYWLYLIWLYFMCMLSTFNHPLLTASPYLSGWLGSPDDMYKPKGKCLMKSGKLSPWSVGVPRWPIKMINSASLSVIINSTPFYLVNWKVRRGLTCCGAGWSCLL